MGLKHQIAAERDVTPVTRDGETATLAKRLDELERLYVDVEARIAALEAPRAKKSRAAYMRDWRAKTKARKARA